MKHVILIITMLFLSFLTFSQTPDKQVINKSKNTTQTRIYKTPKYTMTSFIEKFDSLTFELMIEYDIPRSVMLGISMHESAYGNSQLSREKHNFFGIKKDGVYRSYDNDTESFKDFCVYVSKKKYYKDLVINKVTDYRIWMEKIRGGGYSESPTWMNQVISYINKYKLYELDLEFV